jgi:hypothetical protein
MMFVICVDVVSNRRMNENEGWFVLFYTTQKVKNLIKCRYMKNFKKKLMYAPIGFCVRTTPRVTRVMIPRHCTITDTTYIYIYILIDLTFIFTSLYLFHMNK